MEGVPVQIINIEKEESTQKSTYIFKFEALHEVLSEVKDKEVAVISIGGPSRQGKSFLLSYLLRFLSNPSDNNWIGKDDDPLEGS
jgi:predicted AAA+ superfamily ATPase